MIYELIWRPVFIVLQMAAVLLPSKYMKDGDLHIAENIERRPHGDYELDVWEFGWLSRDAMTLRKVRVRINCYYADENSVKPEGCYYVRVKFGNWTAGVPYEETPP